MAGPQRLGQGTVDETETLRVPPHSVEAEQAVLGGLLLDPTAWDQVADTIGATDFYRNDHRLVFEAIGKLVAEGKPFEDRKSVV